MARGQFLKGSAGYSPRNLREKLENVSKHLERACIRAANSRNYLEKVAQDMVDNAAATEPEFNDYTGNLVSSYSADIFSRSMQGRHMYSKQIRGHIEQYPGSPVNRAKLLNLRHGAALFRKLNEHDRKLNRHTKERYYDKNKVPEYRVLKSWEKQSTGGYRGMKYDDISYRSEVKRMLRKDIESSTGKKVAATSYILLTNKAPYSDFVQRGGHKRKHYNVLRGAIGARNLSQYNTLLKMVTQKEIEEVLKLPTLTQGGNRRDFDTSVRARYRR